MSRTIHTTASLRRAALAAATFMGALSMIAQASGQEAPKPAAPTSQPSNGAAPKDIGLVESGVDDRGIVTLMLNKSTVVKTSRPYGRVSIAQPDVADVNLFPPTEILVTAKKPGTTRMILWDEKQQSQVLDIVVVTDLQALQEQLKTMFPELKIEATGNANTIILKGRVPSLQIAEQAVAVAKPYGPSVLNFLEVAGGQQVMLQVRFAEVSRTATNQLGVNFGFSDGQSFGGSNIGQVNPLTITGSDSASDLGVTSPNPAITLFGRGALGQSSLNYFISALRRNNLLRVLAEPNLIAISGESASFLAGGEFPIPVPQSSGGGQSTITIEYKQFGVRLDFTPIVLGDGKIRLKVSPEVSDLDYTRSVSFQGFVIPTVTKRNLSTVIELNEGQTFAVGGLLNNRVTASKDVTPLLGDIPILGALFRSVRYERSETELVVLVTPYLVEAMNPAQVPSLPGQTWRHPSEGELFWDRDLGGPGSEKANTPAEAPGGATGEGGTPARFRGEFGFVPAE